MITRSPRSSATTEANAYASSWVMLRSRLAMSDASYSGAKRMCGCRQPAATSNAVTLRVSRLNSTPIRWIGSPPPRYFAA